MKEGGVKATVRDVAKTTAVVRVDSAGCMEYLNLIKLREGWRIISALAEELPDQKK